MVLQHIIPTKIMEAVDITVDTTIFPDKEDAVLNAEEICKATMMVGKQ